MAADSGSVRSIQGNLPRKRVRLSRRIKLSCTSILPLRRAMPSWIHGLVQGGGTPVGMLAEMVTAGLNAMSAGAIKCRWLVENRLPNGCRELFGFPEQAAACSSPALRRQSDRILVARKKARRPYARTAYKRRRSI